MAENRKPARRIGSSQAALIYTRDPEQPIMCTVATISREGAELTVLNTNGIPELFDLQIKGEQKRWRCKMACKTGLHDIRITFVAGSNARTEVENNPVASHE